MSTREKLSTFTAAPINFNNKGVPFLLPSSSISFLKVLPHLERRRGGKKIESSYHDAVAANYRLLPRRHTQHPFHQRQLHLIPFNPRRRPKPIDFNMINRWTWRHKNCSHHIFPSSPVRTSSTSVHANSYTFFFLLRLLSLFFIIYSLYLHSTNIHFHTLLSCTLFTSLIRIHF